MEGRCSENFEFSFTQPSGEIKLSNTAILLTERDGIFYEGDDRQLWVINPAPVVSAAKFDPPISPLSNSGVMFDQLLFREDLFDSTTRIRRGRFYGVYSGSGVREWPNERVYVGQRPPIPINFHMIQMHAMYSRIKISAPREALLRTTKIILGSSGYESLWRIIDIEQTTKDELLFTLKSTFPFGILPFLNSEDPEIKGAYEAVLDAALKHNAVSVVDICRESTCVLLAKYVGKLGDLAALIKKVPPEQSMISSAAHIINRLHPRGKIAEQHRHEAAGKTLRPVIDEDASLAVRLFGFLLLELGHAVG